MNTEAKISLTKPQSYIATSTKALNLFMAGTGAGKTYLDGIISMYYIRNFPKVSGFIGANTYDQLNTSTLFRIRQVWKEVFNIQEGIHYVVDKQPPDGFNTMNHNFKSYNNIISFSNGSIIFVGSLDNALAHEGKEFGWAILDETKDSKESDVKEVILMRLRQRGLNINGKEINPLYITTTPAKVAWINEWFGLEQFQAEIQKQIYSDTDYFFKEFENKCVSISSTYHNQANLPANYIQDKKFDLDDKQFSRLIYADPFQKSGGEYLPMFDRSRHIKKVEFNPDLPVHLSFDQNVTPYNTMLCYQIESKDDVYYVRQFDEFCLENPHNKAEDVCEAFLKKYKARGLFYYGDASGRSRKTNARETDYDVVERVLSKYLSNSSNRVNRVNPPIRARKQFMNNVLEGKYNIVVEIDPRCKNTILDCEYLLEDENGEKLKQTVKDKITGQSFQKYGHCLDAKEYFFVSAFKNYFNEQKRNLWI